MVVEDAPPIDTKTYGPPWLPPRHGMKPTRERGRPARTGPGTALAICSTRVDRQRWQATAPGLCFARTHGVTAGRAAGCYIAEKLSGTLRQCMRARRPRSRGAPPPGALLRPSPWRYGRQGGGVLHRRETERNATAVHAGGTPALPGGASSWALLRPSPWRYARQGGGVLHRRETERNATAVHAGGTPAFPGGGLLLGLCFGQAHGVTPAGCRVLYRRDTERLAAGVHAGGTPALPGGRPPITLAARGGSRRLAGPQSGPGATPVCLSRSPGTSVDAWGRRPAPIPRSTG